LPAKRVRHVVELAPEICSLDMGSMNMGNQVFMNTPPHLEEMALHYNAIRSHASLGYKPPAPEVCVPTLASESPRGVALYNALGRQPRTFEGVIKGL
jgi:beta-keto acid cleavage enzyme